MSKLFQTELKQVPKRPESFKTRLIRFGFNFFPAFRGSGARLVFIADDYREAKIRLPLNWRTRNYVGTILGGCMFAGTDPLYMVMLIKVLGRGYIVWDKSSTIRFRKPGRTTLYATARLEDADLETIMDKLNSQEKMDHVFSIDLVDKNNEIYATVEKTIHIRKKTG